ncbi:MAG: hypothetical protein ACON4U_02170 [Myxococcota bacterium]
MILEEAAYCDPQVVKEVVVPLLAMRESVILCISTLLGHDNIYSKMFEVCRPDGTLLFENISVRMICDECLKSDKPEECTHKTSELPRWISTDNIEDIKILLQDDPELLLQESMGISADTTTRAFSEDHIKAWLERPPHNGDYFRQIYTAVDPAGGGASAFAVCTIGLTTMGSVLVSMSSLLHMLYKTLQQCINEFGLLAKQPTNPPHNFGIITFDM